MDGVVVVFHTIDATDYYKYWFGLLYNCIEYVACITSPYYVTYLSLLTQTKLNHILSWILYDW